MNKKKSTMSWRELFLLIREDLIYYKRHQGFFKKMVLFLFSVNFRTVLSYRLQHFLRKRRTWIPGIRAWLAYRMQSRSGCHISSTAKIGRRFHLAHATGVVIGGEVEIGNDVCIYQNVTLGNHGDSTKEKPYPTLRDGVTIYANAVIVGGVILGENSVVAASAFVNVNVPPNHLAVGVPAKIHQLRRVAD
jgi:serine O-acetyltransferase